MKFNIQYPVIIRDKYFGPDRAWGRDGGDDSIENLHALSQFYIIDPQFQRASSEQKAAKWEKTHW